MFDIQALAHESKDHTHATSWDKLNLYQFKAFSQ